MMTEIIRQLHEEKAMIDRVLAILSVEETPKVTPKVSYKVKRKVGVWSPERRAAQAKRMKTIWKKKGASAFRK